MAKDSPIQFKGTSLKIIQTQLRSADVSAIRAALVKLTGNRADFFENDLAVLDFTGAENLPAEADWAGLCALLRNSGLHAIATRGLPDGLAASAAQIGLPALAADAIGRQGRAPEPAPPASVADAAVVEPVAARADAAPEEQAAAEASATPVLVPAAIIDKPVRSGQRFYARGTDLVVLAMVSAGAEIIADGNIHVYAPLRGRALAGASGNKDARIFTTSMEAELVSVAGIYRTFEAGVPPELMRKPATISLLEDGEKPVLNVFPLALQ